MAAANKRARPPIPLPAGVEPPPVDYVDIAAEAGLRQAVGPKEAKEAVYLTETTGTGVALVDFDGDGLLDIFFVGSEAFGPSQAERAHKLYRNLGGLRFRDISRRVGLGSTGWGQGVCAGDADGDGYTDLFVTHWGPDVLLRNVGGDRFEDETAARGLADGQPRWSTGCSFLDFDRDGDLDLFVAHYVDFDPETTPRPGEAPQCAWKGAPIPCGPRGLAAESMALHENDGTGIFRDRTRKAGIATERLHYGLGTLAADFDDDGWLDIYVACDSAASLLFRNLRNGTFEESGLVSGAAYNEDGQEQAGMGIAAADYDGDGRLDLFKTNFAADANTLYRNHGSLVFRDRTVPAGLATATRYVGWGTAFLDFDRDSWPDIFVVNGHIARSVDSAGIGESYAQPRLLFWNRSDGIFHPLSGQAGPGIAASQPSRGAAVGDLNNDGSLEIVVVNLGQAPSLLTNRARARGNWLAVRALLRSGGDAIGARVEVTAAGRTQPNEIRSGASYLSQNDFRLHFGLGEATSARVEIRWPSGQRETAGEFAANRIITLRETDPMQR